ALHKKDIYTLKKIADREREPMYVVFESTGNKKFTFKGAKDSMNPVELEMNHLFGSSPKTILKDQSQKTTYKDVTYDASQLQSYIEQVLQLESVACKDWLTNKVDRSVSGKVATQQTCGEIQLPLNNVAVMAIDFLSNKGIATSIGHAPLAALVNPTYGSKLAIAEALTNLVWAPLTHGLKGVSLSANWMWPAKNEGENARLYEAVKAVSDFACELGINIPTGKDSLSMTQKYPNGEVVYSPGTVIISTVAEASDIRKTVSPDLKPVVGSTLFYIDFSKDDLKLGGSSLGQVLSSLGNDAPTIKDSNYFAKAFTTVQELVHQNLILAGHDISSGGLITALLEMCFPSQQTGIYVTLDLGKDPIKTLFAENPGVVIQVSDVNAVIDGLSKNNIAFKELGKVTSDNVLRLQASGQKPQAMSSANQPEAWSLKLEALREKWFHTSYLLD
ncbi:MAG: AIR synthase-related protein, partial [Bacteroidota bacterium]